MTEKRGRKSSSGGAGTVTLLWIIFLILKLTNVIDWKWLWVFSPIWISASAAVALGLLFLIVVGLILLAAVVGIASHESRTVVKTREIGRATLYKLNLENPIVQELITLDEKITAQFTKKIVAGELRKVEAAKKLPVPA